MLFRSGTDVEIIHGASAINLSGNIGPFSGAIKVAPIESHTYYIAPGSGLNNMGWPVLSLWRKSNLDAPVELVEGVEDMQIEFGLAEPMGGNTPLVPTIYRDPRSDTNYGHIVTVRIRLTVNSVDSVGGTVPPSYACGAVLNDADDSQDCLDPSVNYDGLTRRSFTQTIRLRNKLKQT